MTAICTSEGKGFPHCPLTLLADSDGEIPVRAEQSEHGYEITNFYADGIKGIGDEDRATAECDDSPWCEACGCLIDHWEHP